MTMEIDVTIKLKQGVTDPEGENTKKALNLLGFRTVHGVKTMKTFRIEVESVDKEQTKIEVAEMCRKLLANPVIHDYELSVVKREG